MSIAMNELTHEAATANRTERLSQLSINVNGTQLIRILGLVVLGLVALNLLTRIPLALVNNNVSGGVLEIAYRFDLDRENTIGSWYSTLTLFASSVLLGLIAKASYSRQDKFVVHWIFLSLGFMLMSLDESAAIHEISMVPLRRIMNLQGYFYFAWIVPGICLVAFLGLAYLRFLWGLERTTRQLFILAGGVFISGAIGLEAIGGMLAESEGFNSLRYIFVSTIEETCEMVGILIFLFALCRHLSKIIGQVRLEFRPGF